LKKRSTNKSCASPGESQVSELLILPNGQILVHNLTRTFAELLCELNPHDAQISSRVSRHSSPPHELPN